MDDPHELQRQVRLIKLLEQKQAKEPTSSCCAELGYHACAQHPSPNPQPPAFEPVFPGNFGLLFPDSPTQGFELDVAPNGSAYVLHCSQTARISARIPGVHDSYARASEELAFITEGAAKPKAEATLILGHDSDLPTEENLKALVECCQHQGIDLEFVPHVRLSSNTRSVMVTKASGALSFCTSDVKEIRRKHTYEERDNLIVRKSIAILNDGIKMLCLDAQLETIACSYDGRQRIVEARLDDRMKTVLKAKRAGATTPELIAMLSRYACKKMKSQLAMQHLLVSSIDQVFHKYVYCEICLVEANKVCSSCHYAGYCSTEHQKQDWNSHKRW